MVNRLNLFLLLALMLILVVLILVRVDHSRPNYRIMLGDDMTYSPAYAAYASNRNFASGRTLQDPVAGTLARGEQRFDFQATPPDALRAGEQLTNPFEKSADDMQAAADRGAIVFESFCTSCHGGDGNGNGPVAQRGFPPPPSLLTGKSREMKDGQLFHILVHGQNNMPSFAVQLPPSRRWDVINYIRRLQQAAPPLPTSAMEANATATGPHSESDAAPGSSIQPESAAIKESAVETNP